jgi:hypothetical protein
MRTLTVTSVAFAFVVGLVFIMPKDPPRMAYNPSRPEASDLAQLTIRPMTLKVPTVLPTGVYDAN